MLLEETLDDNSRELLHAVHTYVSEKLTVAGAAHAQEYVLLEEKIENWLTSVKAALQVEFRNVVAAEILNLRNEALNLRLNDHDLVRTRILDLDGLREQFQQVVSRVSSIEVKDGDKGDRGDKGDKGDRGDK